MLTITGARMASARGTYRFTRRSTPPITRSAKMRVRQCEINRVPMNCPATPLGGGSGMKCRKPFRPKTRKITPARYRAIVDAVFIQVLLRLTVITIDANYLDVNISDGVFFSKIQVIYGPKRPKNGPRLARHDQSDARAYPLCNGRD